MPWNYRKTLARTVFLLNSGWSYDESQMSEVRASDKTKSSRVFDGAYARHSRRKGALSGLSDCAQQGILTVPSALRKSDPLVLARSNPGQEQHWERWGYIEHHPAP